MSDEEAEQLRPGEEGPPDAAGGPDSIPHDECPRDHEAVAHHAQQQCANRDSCQVGRPREV